MTNPVSIQKYRNSLNEFQQHIQPHFNNRFSLNGGMSRYNPMAWVSGSNGYSRGVDAELIVIFEDKRNPVGEKRSNSKSHKIYDSIAFSFNQSSDVNGGMDVIFSFKKKGKITSSQSFPEAVFRELIRRVNRTFRNEGVPESRKDLMSIFNVFLNNDEFGIETFDPNKSLPEILGAEGDHIEALYSEGQKQTNRLKNDKFRLEKLDSEVRIEIGGSPEAKQIQELRDKIGYLERKMRRDREKLLAERGGDDLKASISEAKDLINNCRKDSLEASSTILRRVPRGSAIRDNVESWLLKHHIKRIF